MKSSRLFAASLVLAPLALFGCGEDTQPTTPTPPIDLPTKANCNLLATSDECVLPFPSRFNEKADSTSPTGVRMNLDGDMWPKRNGKTALDMTPYNLADGASPVVPMLVHFGFDLDLSKAPGIDTIASSTDKDSPIAIFDMDTGKRLLFFAEMDENRSAGHDGRYALILRAMEPMPMGHRIAVFITDAIKKTDGSDVAASPVFAALRDGTITTNPDVEALRTPMEDVFTLGDANGYPRAHLTLAWDFHTASADWLTGSIVSMRETALQMIGQKGLGYTITKVIDNPNSDSRRIVEGQFEVPTFLQDSLTFDYDQDHHPKLQTKTRTYPFTMVIPNAALSKPLPLIVIGHGLFSDGRDFLEGQGDGTAIQQLVNQHGYVAIATDWIGLSHNDLPNIASKVLPNLDNINVVIDQLQQALINTLTMTKLARGQLAKDSMINPSTGDLLTGTTVYWGASLGGIEGSQFFTISDEIQRGVFGVPGGGWATMLPRSTDFAMLEGVLTPLYDNDPLEIQELFALFQARFDNADPANTTTMMFQHPLPNTPSDRRVILQESIGDCLVPNISTQILAHAIGTTQMVPAFEIVPGLEQVQSGAVGSTLSQYRLSYYDKPLPPSTDTASPTDNNVHHNMNFEPTAQAQILELFTKGDDVQYCKGTCDPN